VGSVRSGIAVSAAGFDPYGRAPMVYALVEERAGLFVE
jgi:hypothetical protein